MPTLIMQMWFILKNLFKKKRPPRRRQLFVPSEWLNKVSEPCRVCKKILVSTQARPVCGCFQLCHEKCFVRSFCTVQKMEQSQKVKCRYCLQTITFYVVYDYSLKCFNSLQDIVCKILISALLITLIFVIFALAEMDIISMKQFYLISLVVLLVMILFLIISSIKKQIDYQHTEVLPSQPRGIVKTHELVLEKVTYHQDHKQNEQHHNQEHQKQVCRSNAKMIDENDEIFAYSPQKIKRDIKRDSYEDLNQDV